MASTSSTSASRASACSGPWRATRDPSSALPNRSSRPSRRARTERVLGQADTLVVVVGQQQRQRELELRLDHQVVVIGAEARRWRPVGVRRARGRPWTPTRPAPRRRPVRAWPGPTRRCSPNDRAVSSASDSATRAPSRSPRPRRAVPTPISARTRSTPGSARRTAASSNQSRADTQANCASASSPAASIAGTACCVGRRPGPATGARRPRPRRRADGPSGTASAARRWSSRARVAPNPSCTASRVRAWANANSAPSSIPSRSAEQPVGHQWPAPVERAECDRCRSSAASTSRSTALPSTDAAARASACGSSEPRDPLVDPGPQRRREGQRVQATRRHRSNAPAPG